MLLTGREIEEICQSAGIGIGSAIYNREVKREGVNLQLRKGRTPIMEKQGKLRMRWSHLSVVLVVLGMALFGTARARAQGTETLRFACTSGTASCGTSITGTVGTSTATTIILASGSLPSLEVTGVANGDTAWLVVLVPTGSAANFTVNGSSPTTASGTFNSSYGSSTGLFGFLGTGSDSDDGFQQFSNIDTLATGTTPTGFTVYYVNLGTNSSGSTGSLAAAISGTLPRGSIIWAFTSGSAGCSTDITKCSSIANDVPPSETLTVVPEPATLALLGTGFLLIGGAIRRRLIA